MYSVRLKSIAATCLFPEPIANPSSSLAAVNACLFCVGFVQCTRIINYNKEQTGSYGKAFNAVFSDIKGQAKDAEKQAEKEVDKVADKAAA